jgi:hypothetical protein
MTRRLLILLPIAACLRADSEREVVDVITEAASGLSAGKPEVFLEAFDPSMQDLGKLRTAVEGLVSQAQVSCSIEVVSNQGDDAARTLELDWILRIDRSGDSAGSTHRQKTVKCQLRKVGRKWRVVSFDPLDLFAPPEG